MLKMDPRNLNALESFHPSGSRSGPNRGLFSRYASCLNSDGGPGAVSGTYMTALEILFVDCVKKLLHAHDTNRTIKKRLPLTRRRGGIVYDADELRKSTRR